MRITLKILWVTCQQVLCQSKTLCASLFGHVVSLPYIYIVFCYQCFVICPVLVIWDCRYVVINYSVIFLSFLVLLRIRHVRHARMTEKKWQKHDTPKRQTNDKWQAQTRKHYKIWHKNDKICIFRDFQVLLSEVTHDTITMDPQPELTAIPLIRSSHHNP